MATAPAPGAIVLLDGSGRLVASWPLRALPPTGLSSVDRLARLHLAARRIGWQVVVRNPCDDLRGLVELAGLSGVLRLEPVGEAEGGEQLGVEEVVEPGDPVA